jgi:hypothetical protein
VGEHDRVLTELVRAEAGQTPVDQDLEASPGGIVFDEDAHDAALPSRPGSA